MKVLHLFSGWKRRARRLQFDFVVKLRDHCDEFYVYGPEEDSKFAPVDYNKRFNMKRIVEEFKPDVLLLQMSEFYSKWLPNDFKDIKNVAKVIIEHDFWHVLEKVGHGTVNLDWYKKNNFDLIIQKSPYLNTEKLTGVPSVMLPFSANDKEFFDDNEEREHKIVFIGNRKNKKKYTTRAKAMQMLSKNEKCKIIGFVKPGLYPKRLREFTCALSGNDIHNPLGKTYEIMASGTTLLTNYINHSKILFGEECFFEYKDDLSDVLEVATEMMNNLPKRKEYTKRAYDIMHEKHMDKHRIIELRDILQALLDGKEIPRKWGL